MKVKCINNNGFSNLTIGKIYEVFEIDDDGYYYIIDDNKNEVWWYPKGYFKSLYEIRNEKIDKLLE
jgi:hypothetical protein